MRVVDKSEAKQAPGLCIFTGDIDGPFLDTDTWINYVDAYGYIHVPKVEEMGRAVGMVPRAEVEHLKKQLSEYGLKLEKLERQLAAYATLEAEITEPDPVAA
jgi:hypothetical protein